VLVPWAADFAKTWGTDAESLKGVVKDIAKNIDDGISSLPAHDSSVGDVTTCEQFYLIDKKNPQRRLVLTHNDKINGVFGVMCVKAYKQQLLDTVESGNYVEVDQSDEDNDSIIQRINTEAAAFGVVEEGAYEAVDEKGECKARPSQLSTLYLMIKLHKAKAGFRAVTGGAFVPTTCISQVLSRALRLLIPTFDMMVSEMFLVHTGHSMKSCPILGTTDQLLEHLTTLNGLISRGVINVSGAELSSLDFTALYPSVMHDDLLDKLWQMIRLAFAFTLGSHNSSAETQEKTLFINVKPYPSKDPAEWSFKDGSGTRDGLFLDMHAVFKLLQYLIANSYVRCGAGKRIFKSRRGIQTGTNAAPEITNLYLLFYEFTFFQRHLPQWALINSEFKVFLLSWKRYIDDCFHIKGGDTSMFLYKTDEFDGMYPSSLKDPKTGEIIDMPLELSGPSGPSVNFLDVTISLSDDGVLDYELYDKREHLIVNGVRLSKLRNFPHIESTLADMCKYGVMTSQLHRFARRFTKASLFQKEVLKLANKMIKEGYEPSKLIQKIVKFPGWRPSLGKWEVVLRRILRELRLQIKRN
jgi:hypothetical protein